jgi:ABC-type nitrate/sulfonate/bicarbonate transport system substrate-binding protein
VNNRSGLVAFLVAATLITACGGGATPSATATPGAAATQSAVATKGPPTEVKVASAPNIFLSALYVADAEGYFKAENLDVKIIQVTAGTESVAALVSGNAQYADIGFDDLVGLAARGEKNLVMVHNILSRVTLTLVMRTDVAQRLGVTRSSPLERRWAALKGLRLGITSPGAPTDKYMRYYLRQAGLDPDRDAQIVAIGGGASLLAALESNQIDAYHLSPPTPYVAADRGIGTILIDGPAGDVPKLADFLYTAWATNRDWAAKNPNAASAFSRALKKGMQKVKADPAAAAPTVAKAIGSTDLALTKRVLDAFLPALSENGCFTAKAVAASLDTMLEAKIIATPGDPAEGVLWTSKYNSC